MAYAVAQTKQGNGSGNSFALSFNSTPAVGSLIVVGVASYNGDLSASIVTDNQGNTYTRRAYNSTIYGVYVAIFSATASTSSGTFTVTANPDGTSADIALTLIAATGQATTPFDQTNSGSTSSTAATSGDITPSEGNELLIGVMTHAGSDRTLTEEAGWTLAGEHEGGTSSQPISTTYKIQTTATTEDADWTIGTGAVSWEAAIASFKASAGAGPITGSLSVTLGAASISAAGICLIAGAASVTLGAVTLSAAGAVAVKGALSATLGAVTISATGGATPIIGSLSATLGAVTVSAAGKAAIAGVLSRTLDAATISSAGVLPVKGSVTVTLGAVTVTSTGVTVTHGNVTVTLANVSLTATGTLPIVGAGSGTLGAVTISATGIVANQPTITGVLSATLAAATLSAAGTVSNSAIHGTLSSTLAAVTGAASGKVTVIGGATSTLAAVTLQSSGAIPVIGSLSGTLAVAILQGIIFMGVLTIPPGRTHTPGSKNTGSAPTGDSRIYMPSWVDRIDE